jgi:hypothetical protein
MPVEHQLPDLAELSQTSFLSLALAQAWEGRQLREPTNLQLLTMARLLDKAFRDYDAARNAFRDHDTMFDNAPPVVRPVVRAPGFTVPLLQAIGHLEDLVASLDRIFRLLDAIRAQSELAGLATLPLPDSHTGALVRQVRNRVAHGDEDIAKGRRGTVATLRPNASDFEIQGHHIEFADIACWLRQVCVYMTAAIDRA